MIKKCTNAVSGNSLCMTKAGKFQSRTYGSGNRIHNERSQDKRSRCTVCGKEN